MNNEVTFLDISKRMEEQQITYSVLELENGYCVIITEYGGRIFGPFDKNGICVLWVNEAFKDAEKFNEFYKNKEWNLGGDRLWMGPELEFYCNAPNLFDATYTVQEGIDPGFYRLKIEDNVVSLKHKAEIFILKDKSTKKYSCKRRITSAKNPLEYMEIYKNSKVKYCGYVQDIQIKDKMREKEMYLEPWILTQINPGGKVIVPFMGEFEYVNYYDPISEKTQKVNEGYVELEISGDVKYKTAYRAANTFGRMGYVNQLPSGEYYLMIRNYYNDPSIPYCSEPWKDLGNRGCSMYFYNDDGKSGGFAEFENSCATIGLDSKRKKSYSTTSLWFFFGEKEELEKIIKTLLGITYKI